MGYTIFRRVLSSQIYSQALDILIDDGKVYIDAWIEEGWDDENDCATDDYKYYGKVIVKDFQGNVISEEIGSLYQGQDGTWWIA